MSGLPLTRNIALVYIHVCALLVLRVPVQVQTNPNSSKMKIYEARTLILIRLLTNQKCREPGIIIESILLILAIVDIYSFVYSRDR